MGAARARDSGDEVEVTGLLTTLNEAFDRAAMHAVRAELLASRTRRRSCRSRTVPAALAVQQRAHEAAKGGARGGAGRRGYHGASRSVISSWKTCAATARTRMAGTGLEPLFPCGASLRLALARRDDRRWPARAVACVDPRAARAGVRGARVRRRAARRPAGTSADPCGERGEFHSFAYAGLMFSRAFPRGVARRRRA